MKLLAHNLVSFKKTRFAWRIFAINNVLVEALETVWCCFGNSKEKHSVLPC